MHSSTATAHSLLRFTTAYLHKSSISIDLLLQYEASLPIYASSSPFVQIVNVSDLGSLLHCLGARICDKAPPIRFDKHSI